MTEKDSLLHLHPFGSQFRLWREKRGYSLKEAAGTIMTPQALSQFERGKTTISLITFSRLLISIGVDWNDFLLSYRGERADYAYSLIQDGPQSLSQLEEALKHHYHDNPELKRLFLANQQAQSMVQELNGVPLTPKQKALIDRVIQQANPNTIEMDLYNIYRHHFPLSYVLDMKKKWLQDLKQSFEMRDLTGLHNHVLALATTANYLASRELYLESQKLIDELREILSDVSYYFYSGFLVARIQLESSQALLYLRQNMEEGVHLAREVLDLYDYLYKFTKDAPLLMQRTNFLRTFNQLNQTGKFLYED